MSLDDLRARPIAESGRDADPFIAAVFGAAQTPEAEAAAWCEILQKIADESWPPRVVNARAAKQLITTFANLHAALSALKEDALTAGEAAMLLDAVEFASPIEGEDAILIKLRRISSSTGQQKEVKPE